MHVGMIDIDHISFYMDNGENSINLNPSQPSRTLSLLAWSPGQKLGAVGPLWSRGRGHGDKLRTPGSLL